VRCVEHGVVAAQVPWARHGAGHTYAFDDTAAWLVTHCSKSAVRELLRVAWRTVGSIVTRVVSDAETKTDRFAGLRRIGIDEISYKRGHRYLTVVVDHDTGVLLWAHPGRDEKTLEKFFDRLGAQRCAEIRLVSADAAEWIANVVADRCENAEVCLDPFHIVAWATKALDEVRREVWNAARRDGQTAVARELKGARYALWKNPADLTARQGAKLASIAQTNQRLYRAYLLKEQLRQVFALKGADGIALLDRWLKWARRCRIPSFVKLAKSITEHRVGIEAALTHGLSNARVESVNTKLRLLTRIAFGFLSIPSARRPRHARPRRTLPTPPRPRNRMTAPTDQSQEPFLPWATVRRATPRRLRRPVRRRGARGAARSSRAA
jgi:transposase